MHSLGHTATSPFHLRSRIPQTLVDSTDLHTLGPLKALFKESGRLIWSGTCYNKLCTGISDDTSFVIRVPRPPAPLVQGTGYLRARCEVLLGPSENC